MVTPLSNATERAAYYQQNMKPFPIEPMSRLHRHWAYLKTPSSRQMAMQLTAFGCVAGGGYTGAKIGAAIANGRLALPKEVDEKINNSLKNSRMETAYSFAHIFGPAFGAVAGGFIGACLYMFGVERTGHYQTWDFYRVSEGTLEAIKFVYADDKILKDFCCDVTFGVFELPVHVPAGHVYDISVIKKAKRINGLVVDPHSNPPFAEKQTIPLFEMAVVIYKRSRFLLKEDITELKASPVLKEALELYLEEVERAIADHYWAAQNVVEARNNPGELEVFSELFGEINDDIDWEANWTAILNQRFMLQNPKAIVLGFNK